MSELSDTKACGGAAQAGGLPARRRRSILRSAAVLAVATIILLVFILALGDIRRRNRAIDQARWHVGVLEERAGGTGVLPLNLEPAASPGRSRSMFEWLNRDDARHLRASDRRVIAAYTVRPLQLLLRDGRAVVFFAAGRFDVQWVPISQFDELLAAQRDEIHRITAEAPHSGVDGP
jgi:hypothetical protein